MAMSEQERQATAESRIAGLLRTARAAEAEGRYRDAQDATDAAADWQFWADFGAERSTYGE